MTTETAGRVYLSLSRVGAATNLKFCKDQPGATCDAWVLVPGKVLVGDCADTSFPQHAQGHAVLGADGTKTVNFPEPFSAKPVIVLQREGSSGAVFEPVISAWSMAAGKYTGFTISASRVSLIATVLQLVTGSSLSGTIIHWSAAA